MLPTETAVINYVNGRVTGDVSVNDGHLTTAQGVVNYINDLRAQVSQRALEISQQ